MATRDNAYLPYIPILKTLKVYLLDSIWIDSIKLGRNTPLVTSSRIVQARNIARLHTFIDIDHEITSTAIFTTFTDSRSHLSVSALYR